MTNGKCLKDSEVATHDLSVTIYESADECCAERIFWLTKEACLVASGIDSDSSVAGTYKFYVDWIIQRCVKDCNGPPPCRGLAQTWDELYSSPGECCEKLSYLPEKECIYS